MNSKPVSSETVPAIDYAGWAALGRTIARRQAAKSGAEWEPHDWEDVHHRAPLDPV